jgi:ArsR family transcriptional regulator
MNPEQLFGLLADSTRLRSLLLIHAESEVCVCELTFALQESQPKISRHLAAMRDAGLVVPRREGTWMHYSLSPDLPAWALEIIAEAVQRLGPLKPFLADRARLETMSNRPGEIRCA